MSKASVVIKKYGDRRLYDTSGSRYVKLEDIAKMIREGMDVQVEDARTGKDLTPVILTQIVMENARDQETALPLQLLRQLVTASDQATHEFLSWYLNSTFDLYQKAQQAAASGSEKLRTGLSEAKSAAASPLEFVRGLLAGHAFPPAQDAGEVEKLRQRIEELEARLAQGAKPARRKGKK
jgi:polyhydroxyalkanoate synthesis repressor PhaR